MACTGWEAEQVEVLFLSQPAQPRRRRLLTKSSPSRASAQVYVGIAVANGADAKFVAAAAAPREGGSGVGRGGRGGFGGRRRDASTVGLEIAGGRMRWRRTDLVETEPAIAAEPAGRRPTRRSLR